MDPSFERLNSLKNNLVKGDFSRAKEKVDDNLYLINSNIRELQEYLFKIGSKNEDKKLIQKA
jgi:hypothetical protein